MTADTSRGRGFAAQVILLVGARLASVGAFFGVSVVAARLLPPEGVGSAAVGQTIGMIAALVANGGLNIATIYFLQRRPDQRASLVPRLVAVAIGACALSVVLVLATAPLALGLVVGEDGWPLLLAAAAMGATMIAFEFSGALLLGHGLTGAFTLMELTRGIGSLLAVALLLVGPMRSDTGFVAGLALGYAAASLLGLARTRRAGSALAPRVDGALAREAIGFGVRGQVGNVFQFLGARLDLLLVPALLDLRSAGLYVIAVRVSDVVGQAATAASSLVFPHVAGQADRSTQLTERTMRMMLLVVIVTAALIALAGDLLLRIAFGDVYADGTAALLVLLVATIPLSTGRVLAADLKGRGRPGLVSWAALVTVGATIVLDVTLIPAFGILGAAAASLFAYALGTIALLAAYRRVTDGRLLALVPRPSDIGQLAAIVARSRANGASP